MGRMRGFVGLGNGEVFFPNLGKRAFVAFGRVSICAPARGMTGRAGWPT